MGSAIVTFTDGDNEEVSVSIEFEPPLETDGDAVFTPAQEAATDLMSQAAGMSEEDY